MDGFLAINSIVSVLDIICTSDLAPHSPFLLLCIAKYAVYIVSPASHLPPLTLPVLKKGKVLRNLSPDLFYTRSLSRLAWPYPVGIMTSNLTPFAEKAAHLTRLPRRPLLPFDLVVFHSLCQISRSKYIEFPCNNTAGSCSTSSFLLENTRRC
ncbi:hypothetical protein CEXT_746011 [Caerostris extrusa]|uniref:Uncharacterized protein n=1 Tax=Caerostris extrusa TaxID=172846 RepID=A0AAV4VWX0_CAEEX|nr:hypothetical protein CEXT_746011 [Caerostris extrusa]